MMKCLKTQVWKAISLVGTHSPITLRGSPRFSAKLFYETPKMSLKLSDLCAKMITSSTERDTMFTLHNPMKVMNERYAVTSHPCPTCNETKTVTVSSAQLFAYHQGGLAQQILEDYDADVRERFISGVCDTCWSAMFADFDDE